MHDMRFLKSFGRGAGLALAMVLAGCGHRPATLAIADIPPPPLAIRPSPPPGLTASVITPPIGADGHYVTINSGLSPAEAVWHLRAALNVAALGCRGAGEAALIADYNALLKARKAELAKANSAAQARFGADGGADWQARFDQRMTRLYNFFAQPAAQPGFCRAAGVLAHDARTVRPEQIESFAAMALPALEAPFLAFYAQADTYRHALAAWQAGTATATASPAPADAAPRLAYQPIAMNDIKR